MFRLIFAFQFEVNLTPSIILGILFYKCQYFSPLYYREDISAITPASLQQRSVLF